MFAECAEHASYISVRWKTRMPNLSDKTLRAQTYLVAAFVWQEWSDCHLSFCAFSQCCLKSACFSFEKLLCLRVTENFAVPAYCRHSTTPELAKSVHMAKWHASPVLQKERVSWLWSFSQWSITKKNVLQWRETCHRSDRRILECHYSIIKSLGSFFLLHALRHRLLWNAYMCCAHPEECVVSSCFYTHVYNFFVLPHYVSLFVYISGVNTFYFDDAWEFALKSPKTKEAKVRVWGTIKHLDDIAPGQSVSDATFF